MKLTNLRLWAALWFLSFLAPRFASADVVVEGEVDIYFKVLNLSEFSDYEFYYEYQSYYYDQGYHPGEKTKVWMKQGEEYLASSKGGAVLLKARLKSDTTVTFETEEEFGGDDVVNDRRIANLVDEIRIQSISEDGLIQVKSKRVKVLKNGERKEEGGSGLGGFRDGPFLLFGINGLILLMPLAALLSLLLFYLWRRNLQRKADARPAV